MFIECFFLSLKLDIHNEVKELIRNRDINAPLDEESVYTPIEWAVANGNFTMPFFSLNCKYCIIFRSNGNRAVTSKEWRKAI